MTQMHEPSQDPLGESRAAAPPEPSSAVTALATERHLGELRNARIVVNPGSIAKAGAVVGVPSVVLAAVGLTKTGFLGVLGLLGIVGVVVALVILAYAIKTWLAGADDWYLYANGIVARRHRRLQAITWSEVSSVTRRRMGHMASRRGALINPETLRGYQLSLKDGTDLFLTASDVLDHGKLLGAQLEQLATQAGIPVSG